MIIFMIVIPFYFLLNKGQLMSKLVKIFLVLFILTSLTSAQKVNPNNEIVFGADRLLSEYSNLIEGKRIGIVTNPSALLSNGVHLVDTLFEDKRFNVTALFGPEHGIRGKAPAGEKVNDNTDSKTGLPVYSLYGKNKQPSKEMLKNVDVLLFDIQDVGARFYTYISTLFYTIKSGAENNIPVIVLDRPDPINGVYVDGPIRKEEQASFVGIAPIPIAYGMTTGELAKYFAGEKLIGKDLKPNLTVIEMKNWKRDSYYDDYNNIWVRPSPNIPDINTAIVYPGMCLIEGTNASEGRGTYHPFLTIGAPYINSKKLISELQNEDELGVKLDEIEFTPKSIPEMSTSPKYKDEKCYGIKIEISDRQKFKSVEFGIRLLCSLKKAFPNDFKLKESSIDRLSGDKNIREMINTGKSADDIISYWQDELNNFKQIRKKYLLY